MTQEFARTNSDRPFITGVVFTDGSGDGLCQDGEGRSGITVTPTHAADFVLTTTAGSYAFEILIDGDFSIDVEGQIANVTVAGNNVKVD